MLTLADAKDDMQSVAASDVWLEKRAFPDYLAYRFKGNDQLIAAKLEKARADLRSGPTKLQRIKNFVEFFGSKQHFLAPGIAFKFLPLLSDTEKDLFLRWSRLPSQSTSSTRLAPRPTPGTIRDSISTAPTLPRCLRPTARDSVSFARRRRRAASSNSCTSSSTASYCPLRRLDTQAKRNGSILKRDFFGNTPSRT